MLRLTLEIVESKLCASTALALRVSVVSDVPPLGLAALAAPVFVAESPAFRRRAG